MNVFDSSAIYKSVSSRKASMLVGQYTTPLAEYELGNIILKSSVIHKVYSLAEARELLSVCELVLERMFIINPDLNEVYKTAVSYHLSFYDAVYASLAIHLKVPLVTLDVKLANKIRPHIRVEIF